MQFPLLSQEDPLEDPHGNSLQYSCLGNAMDGGVWWATVYKMDTTEMT